MQRGTGQPQPWRADSIEGDFTSVVQSLASGEVASATVREESHIHSTEFGRSPPRIYLHPEFHSVMGEIGENCCFSQVFAVTGLGQFFLFLYCVWIPSPCLGLYHVWQGTQVIVFPLGLGHRSWKLLGEHFATPRDQTPEP